MLQFKKPELSDREWVQRIYAASGFRGAEYTFANLYLWSSYYGEIAQYRGFPVSYTHLTLPTNNRV